MQETPPDGSIVITPKEFYDGVKQDIGDIKNDVQALRDASTGVPLRVEKLEGKVGALEARMTYVVGFAAGLSATATFIVSKIMQQ